MATANNQLRHERQLRGWSQVYLAKQIGVPDYYISRWERGEVLPSPYYQQKLCELFGKTTQELGIIQQKENATILPDEQEQQDRLAGVQPSEVWGEVPSFQQPDRSFFSPHPPVLNPETPAPDLFSSAAFPHAIPPVASQGSATSFSGHVQQEFTSEPLPTTPPVPPIPPENRKGFRTRRPLSLFLVLLFFVIISALIGTSLQFIRAKMDGTSASHTVTSADVIVGHLSFTSSGQTSETSNQGIADQIQVQLTHVAMPSAGKSDYAWLLPDINKAEKPMTLLGKLTIQNSTVQLRYNDSQNTNLLSTSSRFLVTEQDSTTPPLTPSADKSTWRYSAIIPQDHPQDKYTFLDHLRHLLSDEPSIKERGLTGGLAIWFYRDMRNILEWSNSAREYWQGSGTVSTDFMRRQAIRDLEYLDGISNVQVDAPPNTAFPILVDYRKGGVPVLQLTQEQKPTGYLYHIGLHLLGLLSFSATSPELRAKIARIMTALDTMNVWLKQLRQDAHQIAAMTDDQLRQQSTLTILNDMATNANYAYVGKEDPNTNTTQEGAEWLYQNTLQLSTVGIQAVKA